MKKLLLTHKKLHLWLLADLCLLAAYFACRHRRAWMNALAERVTMPLKRAVGTLAYRVDFSLMELGYVLIAVAAIAYLVWSIRAVVRARGRRGSRAWAAVLGLADVCLSVYVVFCLLWGVNFWTDSFQDKSGITAEPVAQEDLMEVTAYFVRQLAASADGVPRDETGLFAVPKAQILADCAEVYDPLEKQFPYLAFDDPGVKPMFFSRIMSITGYTGVYCACTGESNVNVDSPACLLPSTAAHELAHQRGFASEQECNFLAVLASTTSGNPAYVYSGWLLGYIYLGNALYGVDADAYWTLWEMLPETVKTDLRDNSAYWAQFRGNVAGKVSDKLYDSALKAFGDRRGIQSYGTVVDLLTVYYRAYT